MFLFTCVLLLDVNEMLALGSSEELSQFLTLLVAASACQPPKPVALDVTGGAEGFKLFMLGERAPPFFLLLPSWEGGRRALNLTTQRS